MEKDSMKGMISSIYDDTAGSGVSFTSGVSLVSDSSEIIELKRKLYIDPVLGCFNRAKFEDDIKLLNGAFVYFSIDANNLKYINDNFGHDSGDFLLKVVAKSGMEVWGDSFYRSGGDEFIACLRGSFSPAESQGQVEHFKSLIAETDTDLPLSAAVGFAAGHDFKEVINKADEMMYLDKAAYKKAHPEYDMRKAKLTTEALQDAIKDGSFGDLIKKYREEKGVTSGVVTICPQEEVDEDFSEGVLDDSSSTDSNKANKNEVVCLMDEDMGSLSVGSQEELYRDNELSEKVKPVVHEVTTQAVKEAVRYQSDKLKLEVSEVLEDEVSRRLSKYERRRRRRDLKERVCFIAKGVVILLVAAFILGNAQLRLRFKLVFTDLGDMISSLVRGEEASSNKLIEDLFRDLGDDLNEVNTEGFNIEGEDNSGIQ